MKALEDYVTTIPDFPKKGIMFRDVTTILSDKDGFKLAIDGMIENLKDVDFDLVIGSESRGFVFGAPVAYAMNKGFILVRKIGKLPREVISDGRGEKLTKIPNSFSKQQIYSVHFAQSVL